MSQKWTVRQIREQKGQGHLAVLTAYDASMAALLDACGIPIILVGDSLGMAVLGYETTLPVTMADMLRHAAAVTRGAEHALVVADMPFMSYQPSPRDALMNAGRLLTEAGADAVKLEGGSLRRDTVRVLVENGIPVMGHVGMTPQSVHATGGYRVQGRGEADASRLLDDAQALETAGAFAVVLECVPAALAGEITQALDIPTIGIGAGPHCDGQVLVINDLLGLESSVTPKFVKQYADLATTIRGAVSAYRADVEAGTYPGPEHSY